MNTVKFSRAVEFGVANKYLKSLKNPLESSLRVPLKAVSKEGKSALLFHL